MSRRAVSHNREKEKKIKHEEYYIRTSMCPQLSEFIFAASTLPFAPILLCFDSGFQVTINQMVLYEQNNDVLQSHR